MNEPTDINSSLANFSLEDGSIDYEKFIETLVPSITDSNDPDKIPDILMNNLTSISIPSEKGESTRETISPSSTSDRNVVLMQKKLHELSPDTEVEKLQNPDHERALTIATFRLLHRLPSLLLKSSLGVSQEDLTLDLKMKLDGLIATTEKEKYWRTPVYDETGTLLAKSHEEFDRKRGYKSNPDGKVSQQEINTIILPRVVQIVNNI